MNQETCRETDTPAVRRADTGFNLSQVWGSHSRVSGRRYLSSFCFFFFIPVQLCVTLLLHTDEERKKPPALHFYKGLGLKLNVPLVLCPPHVRQSTEQTTAETAEVARTRDTAGATQCVWLIKTQTPKLSGRHVGLVTNTTAPSDC